MLYGLARPFLFALDPETAHDLTIAGLRAFQATPAARLCHGAAGRAAEVMGLTFPNRVGLGAGLDKNGEAIDALAALGFGFIEVGTVTPRPQPGNPRPRLFRLPAKQAIINRMGFNNGGVEALIANVRVSDFAKGVGAGRSILGINIGKNFDTPIERAADDYLACLQRVYAYASYVTVNISSPNTKNLRQLQGGDELDALLGALKGAQPRLAERHGRHVPLVLKIAPDLEPNQIQAIADALRRHRIEGVIATNTTLSRDGVEGESQAHESGGLSGAPLFDRSTAVLRALVRALQGEVPVIGVGGIVSGAQALAKLEAGADLVQIYSGLIFRGPELVGECVRATARFERTKETA
jgi:dihydroorotate dehydrogenase